jgi:hypothetical protein
VNDIYSLKSGIFAAYLPLGGGCATDHNAQGLSINLGSMLDYDRPREAKQGIFVD